MPKDRFKCGECETVFFTESLWRDCKRKHARFLKELMNLLHMKFCKNNDYGGHNNATCSFHDKPPGYSPGRDMWKRRAMRAVIFARQHGIFESALLEFFTNL